MVSDDARVASKRGDDFSDDAQAGSVDAAVAFARADARARHMQRAEASPRSLPPFAHEPDEISSSPDRPHGRRDRRQDRRRDDRRRGPDAPWTTR